MTKINSTYGLLLSARESGGFNYVTATVMRREDGYDYPRGVGDYDYDFPAHLKGLYLESLGINGFASTYDGTFIGIEPGYNQPYRVDASKAKRMVKTLGRIEARIAKDEAREPGDILASLCAALKLDFVCERMKPGVRAGYRYSDHEYRWMSVGEGRNRFRELVAAAKANTKTERADNAA